MMHTNRRTGELFCVVRARIKNNLEIMKKDISMLKNIMDKLLLIAQTYNPSEIEINKSN